MFAEYRVPEKYLQAFPFDQYHVCSADEQGSFYIDTEEDYIKAFLFDGDPWEGEYIELLKKYVKPRTIALDIGAHIGTHTVTLSKAIGEHGLVIAFEPQRKIYRELCMNMQLNGCNNVVPLLLALGDRNTEVIMPPPPEGNEGGRAIIEGYNANAAGSEEIRIRRLDDFKLKNVSFIKMDVEAYEDRALEGARKTIEMFHPVIFIEIQGDPGGDIFVEEGWIEENWEETSVQKTEHTIKKLESMGYTVSHVYDRDYLAVPKKRMKSK
jgi:FkbM family methyltransferase